jgi:hypothetical protein
MNSKMVKSEMRILTRRENVGTLYTEYAYI